MHLYASKHVLHVLLSQPAPPHKLIPAPGEPAVINLRVMPLEKASTFF